MGGPGVSVWVRVGGESGWVRRGGAGGCLCLAVWVGGWGGLAVVLVVRLGLLALSGSQQEARRFRCRAPAREPSAAPGQEGGRARGGTRTPRTRRCARQAAVPAWQLRRAGAFPAAQHPQPVWHVRSAQRAQRAALTAGERLARSPSSLSAPARACHFRPCSVPASSRPAAALVAWLLIEPTRAAPAAAAASRTAFTCKRGW